MHWDTGGKSIVVAAKAIWDSNNPPVPNLWYYMEKVSREGGKNIHKL